MGTRNNDETLEESVIHSQDEHLESSIDIYENKVEEEDLMDHHPDLENETDVPVKIKIKKDPGARRRKDEKEKLEDIIKRYKPLTSQIDKRVCDYCKQVFPSFHALGLHIDIDHPLKKEEFDKKYKIYKCVIDACQKLFL